MITRKARARLRRYIVAVACVLLRAGHAAALDAATDLSDAWWRAAESGWGMQLVQTGTTIFATLYVYDAASAPTFLVGVLARTGTSASGDLFRTTGPWFGAAVFDATRVSGARVGTITFAAVDDVTATVDYTVDGMPVHKTVTRQPLRFDDFNGRFPAVVSRVSSNCPTSGFDRTGTGPATLLFAQAGTAMSVEWSDPDGVTCTYRGAYDQQGKVGSLQATYTCSNSEEGNAAFAPLRLVDGAIVGRMRAHGINNGCDHAASFSTVVPR